MEFSQKLYNLLQRVEARLQTAASVSESAHSQAARELLDWCRAQDVPTHDWVTASKLLFSPQVLQVINETLQLLGQPPIGTVHSGQNRYQQAQASNREDKNSSRPRAGRVLVLQPDAGNLALTVLQQPQTDLVLDIPADQLDVHTPPCLLVVENLDMFYHCLEHHRSGSQRLPAECDNALIVFRGYQHDAQSVIALVQQFNALGKPTYYLGDFDPAGLNIALDHGYSHLLLPELSLLNQGSYTARIEPKQQEDFERLQRRSRSWPQNHALQAHLQVLLEQQQSLRHQRYRGALESVPLPDQPSTR